MLNLKSKLLATNYFIDNEYLNQYIELVKKFLFIINNLGLKPQLKILGYLNPNYIVL